MPYIRCENLSAESLARMTVKARLEWEFLPDGSARTKITNRTLRRLKSVMLPGETFEQTLTRMLDHSEKEIDAIFKGPPTILSESNSDAQRFPANALVNEVRAPDFGRPDTVLPYIPGQSMPELFQSERDQSKYGFSGKLVKELNSKSGVNLKVDLDYVGGRNKSELLELFRSQGLILQKPPGTSLHHHIEWVKQNSDVIPEERAKEISPFVEFGRLQTFVIENDWARPFDKSDISGGDIKLPYPHCCFEFMVTGVRVLLFLKELDGTIHGTVSYGYKRQWYMTDSDDLMMKDGKFVFAKAADDRDGSAWADFFTRHVRAICIMLESEVAEALERDQPITRQTNQKKSKKSPRYHVIRLVGRHTRNRSHGSREYLGIVPLHFRRGHWRHLKGTGGEELYVDVDGTTRSRTRIKWMLVGNEDLGFIEKHYRL